MNPVTRAELKQFSPHAREDYIDALVNGWSELERAGINQPQRLSAFLAECAHETGGLTIVREDTRWTAAQFCALWPKRYKTKLDPRIAACRGDPVKLANLAYAARADIGNNGGNDGWDFRGGSFLQATGRAMFTDLESALAVPLTTNPELIENPGIGLKAALWVWTKHKCNDLADKGYTTAIGNAINRGNAFSSKLPIGHESRQQWHKRANAVFGDQKPLIPGMAIGARGSEVEVLQRRLKELNYGTGKIDGAYGPTVARAVASFKADQKRAGRETEPDDIIGPVTWSALNAAEPVTHPERESLSTKEAATELATSGSAEVVAGQRQKAAGWGLVAVSAAQGAQEAGALDTAKEALGGIPQWQGLMSPVIDAVKWGLSNAFWAGTLLFGVWVWSGGHKTVLARVRAHVKGFNLFR